MTAHQSQWPQGDARFKDEEAGEEAYERASDQREKMRQVAGLVCEMLRGADLQFAEHFKKNASKADLFEELAGDLADWLIDAFDIPDPDEAAEEAELDAWNRRQDRE